MNAVVRARIRKARRERIRRIGIRCSGWLRKPLRASLWAVVAYWGYRVLYTLEVIVEGLHGCQ